MDSVKIAIKVLEELDKLDKCDLTLASASCEQFLSNLQVGRRSSSPTEAAQQQDTTFCGNNKVYANKVPLNVNLLAQEVVSLLAPLLQQQHLPEPIQASCTLARAKADIAAKKLAVMQAQLAEISQMQLPQPSMQDEAMPDAQPAA